LHYSEVIKLWWHALDFCRKLLKLWNIDPFIFLFQIIIQSIQWGPKFGPWSEFGPLFNIGTILVPFWCVWSDFLCLYMGIREKEGKKEETGTLLNSSASQSFHRSNTLSDIPKTTQFSAQVNIIRIYPFFFPHPFQQSNILPHKRKTYYC